VASVQHLIQVAGIGHVCIGADFDGGGGLPGLDNVSPLPRITQRSKASGMLAMTSASSGAVTAAGHGSGSKADPLNRRATPGCQVITWRYTLFFVWNGIVDNSDIGTLSIHAMDASK
jgi:hypothetical protein